MLQCIDAPGVEEGNYVGKITVNGICCLRLSNHCAQRRVILDNSCFYTTVRDFFELFWSDNETVM